MAKTMNNSQAVYVKSYRGFLGVDMTSAITEVDDARSPDAVNMIADKAGFPQKRTGYKTVDTLSGRVNGLHLYVSPAGEKTLLVHAGANIYVYKNTLTASATHFPGEYSVVLPESGVRKLLYSTAADEKSTSFMLKDKLYILDSRHYLCYDGTELKPVTGTVPTTVIAAAPTGGGTFYEAVNLISSKRINTFCGTAEATAYQLDSANINSVVKAEIKNASGAWVETTAYSVNTQTGKVTFTTPPGEPPVVGSDNVRITFLKEVDGYAARIAGCTIATLFGRGNDTRVFLSGNAAYRNYDWMSASLDAAYFPDTGYTVIGAGNAAVMGYLKQYENLVIVKEKTDSDASVFLRSCAEDSEGKSVFPVTQGMAGVGAASPYAFATLCDDGIFLSEDGVFGLDTSNVTLQKTVSPRSFYVNGALTRESGISRAFACVHDGFYMLFVNNHVYLADSRRKNDNGVGSFGYEWYYWENIPARCALSFGGYLYFGSTDGKLCRFRRESEEDVRAYSDDDAAVFARWSTRLDDLGDCSAHKTIRKRGVGVVMMPFSAASATIYYETEKKKAVKSFARNAEFDFDNVDFDNFTFGVAQNPCFVPVNKKEKRAKAFRFIIENNRANEGFGLYEIRLAYTVGGSIKH